MKAQPDADPKADQAPDATQTDVVQTAAIDPASTGITALRAANEMAMKLWSIKGPKGTNWTVSAVLLDGPEVAILHQFASGKFAVFKKVAM